MSDPAFPDAPLPSTDDEARPEHGFPQVVAVVITRNPGDFLEPALAALGAQDYPTLSVLVVDAGSERDPTTRVGAVLPGAFVRRSGGDRPGFAGAVNEALGLVEGATFYLLMHDDAVLDRSAVRLMVEEAYRSNAAIVGPKILSAAEPDVLLEVGRAIDRLGGSHTGVEQGEVDQEQHDAVRDVFYVSSAAMLVRSDLLAALGGLDPDAFPGSEDLDFCWRARLAGARVIVAPDARVWHYEAALQRGSADAPGLRDVARKRVRVVLTSYSRASLLAVAPMGLGLAVVEAVVFAFTPRRRQALSTLRAWLWNLRHWRRLRSARRRAQAQRTLHDRDLRELQLGVGARFGAFLSQHHAEERLESLGDRVRDRLAAAGDAVAHPSSIVLGVLGLVAIFGARDLLFDGVPAVGTFARWPSVGDLADAFGSVWRTTGMGSTAPASPALAMMAGLGGVLLGATGLAQSLVVVGALFVGPFGAYRLARRIGGQRAAAAATAIAYGVNPVSRNAIAQGRLGPLVMYALLPFLVALLVRIGSYEASERLRRPLLGLVIVTAVAAAWYPPAALAAVVVALAFLVTAPLVGEGRAGARALGGALAGVAGAAVLLFPWVLTLRDAADDPAAFGFAFRPDLGLEAVLRFASGPSGGGIATWGLLAAAGAGLLVASGPSLAWAARGWVLAVVGWAIVLVPSKIAEGTAVPAPEAGLTVAALGVAIAAGVGMSGIAALGRAMGAKLGGTRGTTPEELAGSTATSELAPDVSGADAQALDRRHRRWPQMGAVVAIAGVVVAVAGFVADSGSGRWDAPDGSWPETVAFSRDLLHEGDFRILWAGDASVLPLDPVEVDTDLAYSLSRNGGGVATEMWRAPVESADRELARALGVAVAQRSTRVGRILAPYGVRYVAVPITNGPGGRAAPKPRGLLAGLRAQLDLVRLRTEAGLVLYENRAWFPSTAVVTGGAAQRLPRDPADRLRAAVRIDLSGARPLRGGPARPGTVLDAEAYDDGWQAESDGRQLAHRRAFGITNAYEVTERGRVTISHDGQGTRYGLIAFQIVCWIVVLMIWARSRVRRRGSPHDAASDAARAMRAAREEERARAMSSDDDTFWSDT